jgi:hypothetical protein
MWMMGAGDVDGFDHRAAVLARMQRIYISWGGVVRRENENTNGIY